MLSGSIGVHALVITLALVLAAQFERTLVVKVHQRLVMPAMLLTPPMNEAPSSAPKSMQGSSDASQPPPAPPAAALPGTAEKLLEALAMVPFNEDRDIAARSCHGCSFNFAPPSRKAKAGSTIVCWRLSPVRPMEPRQSRCHGKASSTGSTS